MTLPRRRRETKPVQSHMVMLEGEAEPWQVTAANGAEVHEWARRKHPSKTINSFTHERGRDVTGHARVFEV